MLLSGSLCFGKTMNYANVYDKLIQQRRDNPITKDDCYCETHHIIPKSEGGDDSKDNLVNLTAREHYIAHLLLAKIYNDWNMTSAVTIMMTSWHGKRKFKFSSKLYEKLRQEHGRKMSAKWKGVKKTPE